MTGGEWNYFHVLWQTDDLIRRKRDLYQFIEDVKQEFDFLSEEDRKYTIRIYSNLYNMITQFEMLNNRFHEIYDVALQYLGYPGIEEYPNIEKKILDDNFSFDGNTALSQFANELNKFNIFRSFFRDYKTIIQAEKLVEDLQTKLLSIMDELDRYICADNLDHEGIISLIRKTREENLECIVSDFFSLIINTEKIIVKNNNTEIMVGISCLAAIAGIIIFLSVLLFYA